MNTPAITWRKLTHEVIELLGKLSASDTYLFGTVELAPSQKGSVIGDYFIWNTATGEYRLVNNAYGNFLRGLRLVSATSKLSIATSNPGEYFKINFNGRYAMKEGMYPEYRLSFTNFRVIATKLVNKEPVSSEQKFNSLLEALEYATSNGGGAFTVFANSRPVFEMDKFESNTLLTTHGWPLVEINP